MHILHAPNPVFATTTRPGFTGAVITGGTPAVRSDFAAKAAARATCHGAVVWVARNGHPDTDPGPWYTHAVPDWFVTGSLPHGRQILTDAAATCVHRTPGTHQLLAASGAAAPLLLVIVEEAHLLLDADLAAVQAATTIAASGPAAKVALVLTLPETIPYTPTSAIARLIGERGGQRLHLQQDEMTLPVLLSALAGARTEEG
ncbi:hypothetical protein AB0I28_32745 [Phytomonospora sp. NPDC050363]|uniref:hypothetical protein n=1 Tax=Phytomonospora sp. NPDC050363 TaxID=3155642 RepID=UPI0033C638A7